VREAWLHLALPAPPFLHPDAAALDLLAMIAGQGDTSRLVREVKRERALVNDIHLSAYTPREQGLLICSMTLPPENAAQALEAAARVLASLGEAPPALEEVQTVQALIESDAIYQRETVQGQARKLGFYETDVGGVEAEARYYAQIAAVTPAQIQDVAKRYLRLDRLVVTGLIPEDCTLDEAQVREVLARVHGEPAHLPAPRTHRTVPGGLHVLPDADPRTSAGPMVVERLPSGVELVVREEHAVPLVAVRAVFQGGLRYETERDNGLSTLVARCLTRGAGKLGAEDLAEELDTLSGSLGGLSGRNTVSLRGEFLSRHFERSFELFASCLTEPTFAEDEVAHERRLLLQDIHTREDKPTSLAFDLFAKTLWKQHPYRLHPHGETASVEGLMAAEVAAYHAAWMRPSQLTLTVVGDVKAEQVIALANRLFPARPTPAQRPPVIPVEAPLTGALEARRQLAKAQSQLVLGFRGVRVTDPWRHALDVLVTVLSGQGGRLFVELRDKRSLAYSVGAMSLEGVEPGYLAVYMGTSPEKVDEALAGMRTELQRLREERITEAELSRARENLIGNHEIGLQRNGARASLIALDRSYGLGAENFLHFADRVSAVDAAAVQDVAQRILLQEASALAIVGP
jgi:zinc protease